MANSTAYKLADGERIVDRVEFDPNKTITYDEFYAALNRMRGYTPKSRAEKRREEQRKAEQKDC